MHALCEFLRHSPNNYVQLLCEVLHELLTSHAYAAAEGIASVLMLLLLLSGDKLSKGAKG